VVEEAEEVRPRLKRKTVAKPELSAQRQIDPGRAEPARGVASQISLYRAGGRGECRLVDSLSASDGGTTGGSGSVFG